MTMATTRTTASTTVSVFFFNFIYNLQVDSDADADAKIEDRFVLENISASVGKVLCVFFSFFWLVSIATVDSVFLNLGIFAF